MSAFYSKSTAQSDRQQRQLSLPSEYISSAQYVRGNDNVVADCLSRPVFATYVVAFDLPAIADSQRNDQEIETYQEQLKLIQCSPNLKLWCGMTTNSPRPFIPSSFREKIISFFYSLSHPSIKTTTKLAKERYFWP